MCEWTWRIIHSIHVSTTLPFFIRIFLKSKGSPTTQGERSLKLKILYQHWKYYRHYTHLVIQSCRHYHRFALALWKSYFSFDLASLFGCVEPFLLEVDPHLIIQITDHYLYIMILMIGHLWIVCFMGSLTLEWMFIISLALFLTYKLTTTWIDKGVVVSKNKCLIP